MKYNEINQPNPSQPDTQNTGMAQNQLLKIGQHAVKIENMIADSQEISEWASNKINLASSYVKKIHNTLSEFDDPREKTNVRPVTNMDPKELGDRIEKAKAKLFKKPEGPDLSKLWAKEKPATEDAMTSVDVDRVKGQGFSDKQIKMAYGVLNDPRFKDNYSGAYNVINKIAPGLADHPSVANALRKANEVQELDDKERTMSTIKHSSDKNVAFFDKMMKRYGPKLMELIIDYAHTISDNEQKGKEKLKKWGREDDIYLSDYYDQLNGVDEDFIYMLHRSVDTNPKLIDFFYDKVEQAKKAGQFAKTSRLPDPEDTVNLSRKFKDSAMQEERQEGFAVRYSLDGVRKVQAYKTEKDAQHRAKILRSMGGVKDVSITTHTLNFKKESTYESKLATMLNQRLK